MYFSGVNPVKLLVINPGLFYNFYLYWGSKIAFDKMTKRNNRPLHYAGRIVQPHEEGNSCLAELILSGKSFMTGRYGTNEVFLATYVEIIRDGAAKESLLNDKLVSFEHCGLFPQAFSAAEHLNKEQTEATMVCDLQCVVYGINENYFLKKYLPSYAVLSYREIMDFWRFEHPWTGALEGKKVLVIHPLAELIERQYKNRDKLFANPEVLPAFALSAMKAVQTINTASGENSSGFNNWGEALDYMYNEALTYDFDIALIACGAYGFSLAGKLKRAGKGAIHMGGVLQMLFGIKGGRWDVHPDASKLYNEYWVRPGQEDMPARAETVEDSCYW